MLWPCHGPPSSPLLHCSTRTVGKPSTCRKLSTCPKLNFDKKKFINDCHLRCQHRVSGQLLPLQLCSCSGLGSAPEPWSVPIVVFINLISTVAFAMLPVPEADGRSSSSCGQLWWHGPFPFCGLLRLT